MADSNPFRTWTPEVYETLHKSLSHISEGIDAPLNQLSELLDLVFPVFSNVLQNPPPSEADRAKLLAGTCKFESMTDNSRSYSWRT